MCVCGTGNVVSYIYVVFLVFKICLFIKHSLTDCYVRIGGQRKITETEVDSHIKELWTEGGLKKVTVSQQCKQNLKKICVENNPKESTMQFHKKA